MELFFFNISFKIPYVFMSFNVDIKEDFSKYVALGAVIYFIDAVYAILMAL